MGIPRLEICLDKIQHNATALAERLSSRGIRTTAVTKAVCGDPAIAAALVSSGIDLLADSRLANIARMRQAKVQAEYVLLRTLASEADAVVELADVSLNSELTVIGALSSAAMARGKHHKVILMVELGDLREGLLPAELFNAAAAVLQMPHIELHGIGTNLACFSGVRPDRDKMMQLSRLATAIEHRFNIKLAVVSGGNSANYDWLMGASDTGRINNLRIGEALLLGCETLQRRPIPGLYSDAFHFVTEVIEVKTKPSKPYGDICQDSFGAVKRFEDRGRMRRAILAGGRQDVAVDGLIAPHQIAIIGASSDHIICDASQTSLNPGQTISFGVTYRALLAAMNSPYVAKTLVKGK